ncbi:MAG: hypothetical protein NTW01_00260 [Gammaproteobacteria bacterium]|jgi:hypothetical protein|uniref:hypothetical protein n=1 Tax=Nevskia sp. TaxID=1929292 RepID=UPI00403639AE|nr:hypothetical protein [Gammaproteobacteria bacterium]
MALEWLLGTALLATIVLLVFAALRLLKLKAELQQLDADLQRALADGRHQAERLAGLETLREAQATAEEAIAAGGSVVRDVHRNIASIPFDVLESIPATRERAKAVRDVHDTITNGVYGALAGLNRAVGRELRKGLKAGERPAGEVIGPAAPAASSPPAADSDRDAEAGMSKPPSPKR